VLACLTDQYRLVTNLELLDTFGRVADTLGTEIVPRKGTYWGGRASYQFDLPGLAFTPSGDTSPTVPVLYLGNDYRGQGNLTLAIGWLRLVCTNGARRLVMASSATRRHVGQFSLTEWIGRALQAGIDAAQVEGVLAEALATTPAPVIEVYTSQQGAAHSVRRAREMDTPPSLSSLIYADTATRYHADLSDSIGRYMHELGPNLWALAQAITDVSSHRMQERRDGGPRTRPNMGADDWEPPIGAHHGAPTPCYRLSG
jgi:hypothetical protein